ncbi:hypothetical protein [Blastococcus xanthinilyticus]|uniref:Uncharacterized protein n=1 Tax=Blastococcus xanthinilyticus TaxID=1564164 RepID=A0A5S5CS55_9ACTN|nr:hypothetical protein [Blastococcus xanthinilyticus]TYP84969.1 hypothetical protein BD833_11289 [Blastococcus xanthinilyticus]
MLHQEVPHQEASTGRPSRGLPPWALVPVAGLGWWLVGYLPALLEELLAGSPVRGWPLVPLLATRGGALVTGAFAGGIAAGLLGLLARRGRRRTAVGATGAGMAAAMAVTLLLVGLFLADQRPAAGDDGGVVAGLGLLTVLAGLLGWALGSAWVVGRVGLGVALAALATAVPAWSSSLQIAVLNATQADGLLVLDWRWTEWAGAAVLAAALVVIGIRPAARLAWWAVVLVGAWFVEPAFTAVVNLEFYLRGAVPGMPGVPETLSEALAAAVQEVFWVAARPDYQPVAPLIAAVVVAALVCLVRPRLAARRATTA